MEFSECNENNNTISKSCGAFISTNSSYEYLTYTSNLTLPINLTAGYNYINTTNKLIPYKYIPIIIGENLDETISFPIDCSTGTIFRDFTFKYLDVENKTLVSVKQIYKSKFWRYYVNLIYNSLSNVVKIGAVLSTPGFYYVKAVPFASNYVNNNNFTDIQIIHVNTCPIKTTTKAATELTTVNTGKIIFIMFKIFKKQKNGIVNYI